MSSNPKNESMNEGHMSKSYISSKNDISHKEQTYILRNQKNYSVGFEEVFKIYKFKLEKLKNHFSIKKLIEKFWELAKHNFEGELEKDNFISLLKKIYRVILPYFNYGEINSFLEGEWNILSKGKNDSINYQLFEKYLFNFAHCWTVHISKYEYTSFLEMIYSRIVKYLRTDASGKISEILPLIRVKILKTRHNSEYEDDTWEPCQDDEVEDSENYVYTEIEGDERKKFKRPLLNYGYLEEEYIVIYNEEVIYDDKIRQLNPMEILEPVMMNDEEIVIFGYPTQFVLMHFKNRIGVMVNMIENGDFEKGYQFKMTDFPHYDKYNCILDVVDTFSIKSLSDALLNNKSILLSRDVIEINNITDFGQDFIEDELNLYNNTRINYQFYRKINIQEIKISDKKKIHVNIDHLILDPSYKKALENVIKDDKIGLRSGLWTEKLNKKFKCIIETKFTLIFRKLLHLIQNIGFFSSIVEIISDDIKNEHEEIISNTAIESEFLKNFESREKIIKDKFDSDMDIIDEANKKSPLVLVLGPPMMGKTSICKKLAEELSMVFLNPLSYFESIFQKVSKFEEELANSGEDNQEPEEGEEADPNKPKKIKKGPESLLSKLELSVYNELISGREISHENLQEIYRNIIHSDLAQSRGIIIEHNSSVFPEGEGNSFSEQLFNGLFGNIEVDFIIELTMQENEIHLRKETIKFNLKSTNIITQRDIELMLKPKKLKKITFEDEVNEDEENAEEVNMEEQPVELSDEEKEKIPKESDLLEIQDFDKKFQEALDYYNNVQIPIFTEIVKKFKKNYYRKIDITGFDFDDAADLIRKHLDFSFPERPVAKPLEQADFKDLLMSNREGILPFRRWSLWKTIDPVALKDDFVIFNGSTEFPADFMCRVFLFISEENRKKFLENPKKYLNKPPEVPSNYRVGIFGPPKSGKNTVAKIINNLFGWKKISIEEIHEQVKEYQKSLEEPEPNNIYSYKIHYAALEWKELTTTNKKEKKPETFYSKVIFMLDYLGIPLDRKKSFEQFKEDLKYNEDKLNHLLNPPIRNKKRKSQENIENVENEEKIDNFENMEERHEEENINIEGDENIEKEKDEENFENLEQNEEKIGEDYQDNKNAENNLPEEDEEPYEDPFPPEDDYLIEDLRTEDLYYRFNLDGGYPRPGGFILMMHPINDDEVNKFLEFNIILDKIIYLVDESEEPLRALVTRRNPNFEKLDEEKQNVEIEKTKGEVAKIEEVITLLKEKYSKNNEDPVIQINCADSIDNIKTKLQVILNPFYPRIDQEEKSYGNADVPEDKIPINKGEFGIFCPVTYKEENWLYYCSEEFETQLNHRKYRFASEKEMELFKKSPLNYINLSENYQNPEKRLAPVKVLPPHIYISGHQGSGISTLLTKITKEFKLRKRELKKEFMSIWDDQRQKRKTIRVQKKREELVKQKEDQEAEKKASKESNPEGNQEEGEEMNIEEMLANDAQLDEDEEGFNSIENDKNIFKSLFDPFSASAYDTNWFEMNEKIATQFIEFMIESRKVPNVFVFVRVTLKTILERHLNIKQIKEYHSLLEEKSKNKKLETIEKIKKEKREEEFNRLKEEFANEDVENAKYEEGDENAEGDNPEKEKKVLPEIDSIHIELSEEEIKAVMDESDPDLPEYQSLVDAEKDRLVKRYEENNNFLNDFIDQLKAKLIPVIEINNDNNIENVYKNLIYQINPYIKNRDNLIEKQLIHMNFPELTMRKIKDLYSSQIYRLGAYRDYSPINSDKLSKSVDYPLIYRDRLYFFNSLEERNIFAEEPLKYRTGKEFPLDVANSCLNNLIYVIGNIQSGKTSISRILEEKGFKRITLRKAVIDLLDENNLKTSNLRNELINTLSSGQSIDDHLAIKILKKRLQLQDCIGKSIVIDGFPFTLSQTRSIIYDKTDEIFKPSFVFVCDLSEKIILERARKQKNFKKLIPVITERLKNTTENLPDIIKAFKNRDIDIRYLDTSKSFWYLKDLFLNLIETKRMNSLKFAAEFNYNKPCNLNGIAPYSLLKYIVEKNKNNIIQFYSPVALKINNEFNQNKYINFQNKNHITYYKGNYCFLKNEEEFKFFCKNPEIYYRYLEEVKLHMIPVKFLKPFDLAKYLCENKIFEYQSCCPVSYVEEKLLKDGKIIYSLEYRGKLYQCENADNLIDFSKNPDSYNKIKIKVKTIDDNIVYNENQVNFENTVNYLETNFGSFITKGMLELSKNRIKYPFLSVKETSIKYLALFLKANNPNNNEYAKKKYSKKLDEFLRNARLPYDLLEVYDIHNSISDDNKLKKDLVRNQLNNLAEKYDDLMEKAKIQKNTRFDNFFKN